MSVLYSIFQVSESVNVASIIDHLEGEGITRPPGYEPGRFPTPKELRQVLDSFKDCKVEYFVGRRHDGTHNWQANIESLDQIVSQSVLISGIDYSGDENAPLYFYLQGTEFMNTILQELTHYCGWITLMTDIDLKDVTFFSPKARSIS